MSDIDQAREQLRLIIREFSDGPMGRGGDPSWTTLCETYEALLAEVKRLRFHLSDVVDELDPDNYEDEMYEWVLKMKQMYGGVGD